MKCLASAPVRGLVGTGLGALLVLASCAGPAGHQPPDMQYGLDECAHCRMIVSEPRHAAAVVFGDGVPADGRTLRFDDLGCLMSHLAESPDAADARVWVHDADGRWLDGREALYRHLPDETTPMGYGFVAVRTDDGSGASLLDWSRLPAAVLARQAEMRSGTAPSD